MKLTQAAAQQGGAPIPLAGTWTLGEAVGVPPQRYFRQVLHLRFSTGGSADRMAIAGATLKGSFKPYRYDALTPLTAALQAQKEDQHGGVLITLDAPRRIDSITVSSGVTLSADKPLGLHRLDGQAVSDQPTVTAAPATAYGYSQVGVSWPPASIYEKAAEPVAVAKEDKTVTQAGAAAWQSLSQDVSLPQTPEFTDVRFVLRAEGQPDGTLTADDLWEIGVESAPAAPRLGLAAPDKLDDVTYFWPVPGQATDAGNVDAGDVLAQALSRYTDDLAAQNVDQDKKPLPLPGSVDVALVIASDAPCEFEIEAAEVIYRSVQESFPDRAEKQVLRFGGERIETQQVALQLPAGVTVQSATLKLAPSLRAGQQLAAGQGALPGEVLAQEQGAYLGQERWVAQRLTAPAATSVSGLALALMALSPKTQLAVELQEDCNGFPSGRRLAVGSITLEAIGVGQWARLLFEQPVVVPSAPAPSASNASPAAEPPWLLVKAGQGSALWLAEPVSPAGIPLRVLEQHSPAAWSEVSVLDTLQGQVRLFSSAVDAGQPVVPLTLDVGGRPVALLGQDPASASSDLTADPAGLAEALNQSLGAQPIALSFTAGMAGLVTVYPPHVEYDLPG